MNISYSWLKEYVDVDLTPEQLSAVLTGIGLEVEAVEKIEEVKGGMEGLVTGKVLTCEKHPNADKLHVTTVDIGQREPLHIVCGAPNVSEGQKVVVAPPGTTLYKGDEQLTIQRIKIRGELSEGMICAEDEIGIGTSHDGIIVLEDSVPVGIPAREYYQITNDTVFTIGLTPNRIDAGSHYGVARDLAAFLSRSGNIRARKPDISAFSIDAVNYPVTVIIENVRSCKRYAGISVTGVHVGPSPGWLKKRLLTIGLNPINNVVDITNFVLHELGQPLHAFDADLLAGRKIVVKNLPAGTLFITLDEQEHELSGEDLMICDAERPVGIAGVFGGLNTGITEKTRNVFIESAYFNPVSVRKTARRLGISTDASFRFERGIDPDNSVYALKRAAQLIRELAGGKIDSDLVDVYPEPIKAVTVDLQYAHIDRLIGKHIDHDTIKQILTSLEIEIIHENDTELKVSVPPFRVDVTREADVIEEILRIYGYNNVEISKELHASISYTDRPDREKLVNIVSDHLSANGFSEIMNNSLTRAQYYEDLKSYDHKKLVHIYNPLSNDLNVMRQTLLFGGLETIVHNTNRKNPDLKLYEFGTCYFINEENKGKTPLDKYDEIQHMAVFVTGRTHEPNWNTPEQHTSFFTLKKYVESILLRIGIDIDELESTNLSAKSDIFGEGLAWHQGPILLSELGTVSRQITKVFDIKAEVFFADICWNNVLELVKSHKIMFSELPKYPEVKRDLSMILDKSVTYGRIRELAFKTETRLLKRINLFDVYEGDRIEKGKKSYAVSFTLLDETKTLTDTDIDKVMNGFMKAFEKELKAQIRH